MYVAELVNDVVSCHDDASIADYAAFLEAIPSMDVEELRIHYRNAKRYYKDTALAMRSSRDPDAVEEFEEALGLTAELGERLGVSKSAVNQHLSRLWAKGWVTWSAKRGRTLKVLE